MQVCLLLIYIWICGYIGILLIVYVLCIGNLTENLEKQKENLTQKLNLGAVAQFGFDTNVLYTVEDLKIEVLPNSNVSNKVKI